MNKIINSLLNLFILTYLIGYKSLSLFSGQASNIIRLSISKVTLKLLMAKSLYLGCSQEWKSVKTLGLKPCSQNTLGLLNPKRCVKIFGDKAAIV